MPRVRPSVPLLALAAILVLCVAPLARAGDVANPDANECARLMNAELARGLRTRVARPGTSASASDTTWVGFRAGQTGNWWRIGVGPNRPGTHGDGVWSWDTPVQGDSLQGWWPIRHPHTNVSGAVLTDANRPWWAVEIGNNANYVINQGRFDATKLGTPYAGNRTFGVVGVWHSDPGSAVPGPTGTGTGVAWTPLAGTRSAWMGLRQHGDLAVVDPVTGNPFNLAACDRVQVVGNTAGATATTFPGYANSMDQMLYRDVDITSASGAITLSFRFATQMSTSKATSSATRTGWFEGDPLSINSPTPGNFISAEAGVPVNSQAPIDSFQVYVGKPVEGTWRGSDDVTRPVYDPLRRWFNEVLDRNARFWKFGRAGVNPAQTVNVVVSSAEVAALKAGGNTTMRVVFRVHTNAVGSDVSGPSSFTSQGRGAAQVDDVSVNLGAGAVVIGDFEGSNPATDIDNLQPATAAWRSTGKPPAAYFHVHDLAALPWNDLCGGLESPIRTCDMRGAVIAMGDHDAGEAQAGTTGTTEANGNHGILSPTVNLRTAGPGIANGWDLTGDMVNATAGYRLSYEIYTELFDIFNTGAAWQFGAQSYPALQPAGGPAAGTAQWGDTRIPGCLYFNPLPQCFGALEYLDAAGLVVSANAPAPPDSIRIYLRRLTQCYRFGVTSGCQTTAGAYFDNVALAMVDAPSALDARMEIWNLFHDTFPFTETPGLPGTAAFDTTSALVRTGLNIAQQTSSLQRFDVPGDSVVVVSAGPDTRVDLVFRVRPGVGNHVVVGDPSSGLRRVPTSTAAVTPGDGSWWDAWRSTPGDFATPGATALHLAAPGGWDPDVWMSARCDTAQTGLFPKSSAPGFGDYGVAGGALASDLWMTTYHESDPHLATLGIARPMCFLSDTAGAPYSNNIVCGTAPAWLLTLPQGRTGWAGNLTTTEGTKILPDGLLTPGAHVQYFLRRSAASAPGALVAMCPDTTRVYPQAGEGSLDGHRWQQFGVLPDRWKDPAFGGQGMACMLVLDWADRRGDELAWVSTSDTMAMTTTSRRGAHNGWSAAGGADVNDPAGFVSRHGGQPGTTWDLYGVKAGESLYTPAGTLGGRLAYRDPSPANLVHGKYARMAPTPEMLAAYYRMIVLLTGDLNSGILGPFNDRSPDDRAVLGQFLQASTPPAPKGLLVFGGGFVESEWGEPFVTDLLGLDLLWPSYRQLSGNLAPTVPLGLGTALDPYGQFAPWVRNRCDQSMHDVVKPNPAVGEAVAAVHYPPGGAATYAAAVDKPPVVDRPWHALTHGFRLGDVVSPFGDNTHARHAYAWSVFNNLFGFLCPTGMPIGVGQPPGSTALRDYLRLSNNPLRTGDAVVSLGLAAADRVDVRLYDVSGRRVRALADRRFPAGEHRLAWDGRDDAGRAVARGVYFARVRFAERGFEDVRKVVVLR